MFPNTTDERNGKQKAEQSQTGNGLQHARDTDGDAPQRRVTGADNPERNSDGDSDSRRNQDELHVLAGELNNVVQQAFEDDGVHECRLSANSAGKVSKNARATGVEMSKNS